MGRGPAIEGRVLESPTCGLDGPAISIPRGAGRPLFYGAPSWLLEIFLGEEAFVLSGAEGPCPRALGACGRMPPRMVHSSTGALSCGSPRLRAVPLRAGGLAETSCGFHRRPLIAPAEWDPGASSSGGAKGVRFRCREPSRPSDPFPLSKRRSAGRLPGICFSSANELVNLSAAIPWMIIDMVLHLRTLYPLRRASGRWADPGDLDMCTKYVGADSRPRAGGPLALLIPARRQPTGGPARVP